MERQELKARARTSKMKDVTCEPEARPKEKKGGSTNVKEVKSKDEVSESNLE